MIQKNSWIVCAALVLILSAAGCNGKDRSKPENGETAGISDMKAENPASEILKEMLTDYPPVIQESIMSDTDGFLALVTKVLDLPEEMFVMADKQHALGEDFIPGDLVPLTDYPELSLSRKTLKLRKIVLPDLLRMVSDAQKEGLTLVVSSAYRSYDYQKMLFEREVKLYGLETAERESARPGTSQHQLGVTIDFGSISDEYADTPPGKWLLKYGWKYGFSLSYPKGYEWLTGYRPEVWHYRYITPVGTELQRKYFNDVQQYMLMFLNENRTYLVQLMKEMAAGQI